MDERSTSETCIHPLVTPLEGQGAKFIESAGSLLELIRPVLVTGQTSLTRDMGRQRARSAPEGNQDKRNLHLDQHLQIKLITSA